MKRWLVKAFIMVTSTLYFYPIGMFRETCVNNHVSVKKMECLVCKVRFKGMDALNENEFGLYMKGRYHVDFAKGETIVKQGTPVTNLFCIKEGMAKLYVEEPGGKCILLSVLKPGDFVIGLGVFNDYMHHFSVTAITPVSTCLIQVDTIETIFKSNPEFAVAMMQQCHTASKSLLTQLVTLGYKNMAGRTADALLYLAREVYQSNVFSTTLSRQDLADLCCLSKETFIRMLKQLKEDGIIDVRVNTFEIKSIPALKRISKLG